MGLLDKKAEHAVLVGHITSQYFDMQSSGLYNYRIYYRQVSNIRRTLVGN